MRGLIILGQLQFCASHGTSCKICKVPLFPIYNGSDPKRRLHCVIIHRPGKRTRNSSRRTIIFASVEDETIWVKRDLMHTIVRARSSKPQFYDKSIIYQSAVMGEEV